VRFHQLSLLEFHSFLRSKEQSVPMPPKWPRTSGSVKQHVASCLSIIGGPIDRRLCPGLVGEMTHGPWAGQTYGGSSFVADETGKILLTLRAATPIFRSSM